ncbi:DUF3895 domain-containing protein [Paenibacillus tarimensis]
MILSVQDREQFLSQLSEEQREFLQEQLIRGRRTVFANAMAREKGYHIPDHAEPEVIEVLLDDWIYTGYIDAGAVSPELRCECGRPLRYQHHVKHRTSGEVKKFGIEHLKEHLGIDVAVVSAIKKGFDAIDYELDELLLKINGGWQPEPGLLTEADVPVPGDVRKHLELGLPLLEKQIRRLRQNRPRLRMPASMPAERSGVKPVERENVSVDLFTWFEEPEVSEEPAPAQGSVLPASLQKPVERYIGQGVRSARVVCELLIREHGASEGRFSTGKPYLYPAVCQYIEAVYPDAQVDCQFQEDRYYTLVKG